MLKRIVAMVLALSFVGIVAMAPNAVARGGKGNCGLEDKACVPEI